MQFHYIKTSKVSPQQLKVQQSIFCKCKHHIVSKNCENINALQIISCSYNYFVQWQHLTDAVKAQKTSSFCVLITIIGYQQLPNSETNFTH